MTEETELTSPTSKLPVLRGKEDNIMKLNQCHLVNALQYYG